ncbi:hypothetical protein K504DRAFT_452186 [Pleomassaria siparia CBS 279.74]|uniref:Uncharacterized protein n=1 Tax=Pleomassaria siparia CBS 279.74 TaxID=1314801 RepID=A0A6G1JRQ5_9PLEO|nr:hypothetical protein K504DRAFT_452186 [Pleomassaria siparia CBS 279.74]
MCRFGRTYSSGRVGEAVEPENFTDQTNEAGEFLGNNHCKRKRREHLCTRRIRISDLITASTHTKPSYRYYLFGHEGRIHGTISHLGRERQDDFSPCVHTPSQRHPPQSSCHHSQSTNDSTTATICIVMLYPGNGLGTCAEEEEEEEEEEDDDDDDDVVVVADVADVDDEVDEVDEDDEDEKHDHHDDHKHVHIAPSSHVLQRNVVPQPHSVAVTSLLLLQLTTHQHQHTFAHYSTHSLINIYHYLMSQSHIQCLELGLQSLSLDTAANSRHVYYASSANPTSPSRERKPPKITHMPGLGAEAGTSLSARLVARAHDDRRVSASTSSLAPSRPVSPPPCLRRRPRFSATRTSSSPAHPYYHAQSSLSSSSPPPSPRLHLRDLTASSIPDTAPRIPPLPDSGHVVYQRDVDPFPPKPIHTKVPRGVSVSTPLLPASSSGQPVVSAEPTKPPWNVKQRLARDRNQPRLSPLYLSKSPSEIVSSKKNIPFIEDPRRRKGGQYPTSMVAGKALLARAQSYPGARIHNPHVGIGTERLTLKRAPSSSSLIPRCQDQRAQEWLNCARKELKILLNSYRFGSPNRKKADYLPDVDKLGNIMRIKQRRNRK